ncbi:hypothetical protein [Actinomadura fibrosa]|uniref:Secreted protein n=1 Tax=Actinomadura fibrosa TaxID=111802 RepID=A0ABW2XLI2_9ACTN|nr:hypothetical protein [Actinomadura fibrosa]
MKRRSLTGTVLLVSALSLTPQAHADTTWHSVASPFVPGGTLSDVAAVSSTDAWVVGTYYHVGSTVFDYPLPVMQRWTGSGWRGYTLPNGLNQASLDAVAATSANDAWATGRYSDANGLSHNWILRWNGTSWTSVPIPGSSDASAGTSSVDARPGEVWVSYSLGFVYRLSNGTWTSTYPTDPDHEFRIARVRTSPSGATWIAGTHGHWEPSGWTYYPNAAQWNGTTWVERPVTAWPDTAETLDILPLGPESVWAVGQSGPSRTPLLAHWDGSTWHNTAVPTGVATLSALAPDGQGGAYASGKAADTEGAPALLHLDAAGTWTRVQVPQSPGTWNADLTALSVAPNGSALWATGTSKLGTLVMTNG